MNIIEQARPMLNGQVANHHKIIDFIVDMATGEVDLTVGSWILSPVGPPDETASYTLHLGVWNPAYAEALTDRLLELPEWVDITSEPYTPEQAFAKMNPPEYTGHWNDVARVWIDDRPLADIKDAKWVEMKIARDEKEHSPFLFAGKLFDADSKRINGAATLAMLANMAGSPYIDTWTTADNSTMELDADAIIALGVAYGQNVKAIFERGRQVREQIGAASTAEEVAAIVWDIGT